VGDTPLHPAAGDTATASHATLGAESVTLRSHVVDIDGAGGVLPQLRTRVVREPGRETWFVVNESDDDLATIPLAVSGGSNVRRVQVNGEVAEFSASSDLLLVRPRRSLRVGAGTIVTVQLR
jgi:hypothetical protein